MAIAIVSVIVPVVVGLVSMTWYLSARLTTQDIRLGRIEKILRLNGDGDNGYRHNRPSRGRLNRRE